MSWFKHVCWYCGRKSKDVYFLCSSSDLHYSQGLSPWQCKDSEACDARRLAVNKPLGWHVISGEDLLAMLRRVRRGEDPDMVYAQEYANAARVGPQ